MSHLLDNPVISQRYFFPRPPAPTRPFPVVSAGLTLACQYIRPHQDAPTVIFFHGNGEVVADYPAAFHHCFTNLGVNLLMAEYRGYGGSDGEPALVAMFDDVPALVAATGVAPDRIILFGRSLGSYYAAHGVSLFPDVAGLVLESGIADPLERLLLRVSPEELGCSEDEFEAAVTRDLNQRAKLSGYKGHQLVMHTRHDGLVDLSHAERNHAWAGGTSRLKVFERGTHNSILVENTEEYFQTFAAFLDDVFG